MITTMDPFLHSCRWDSSLSCPPDRSLQDRKNDQGTTAELCLAELGIHTKICTHTTHDRWTTCGINF